MTYDVVVPTRGRPSLNATLAGLASGDGPLPRRVVIVDDRKRPARPLELDVPEPLRDLLTVLTGRGRGPAAARNLGWRQCRADWIAFLDDDVLPPAGWRSCLARDISEAEGAVASQGRVLVPRAEAGRQTDWERCVIGLESAAWATADIAYRREVLLDVGGFDERFSRAYREDADLGLRAIASGGSIVRGRRWIEHPVGRTPWWHSVSRQRGNADDALMLWLHGPGWERRAGAGRGSRRRHLATSALLATTVVAFMTDKRGPAVMGLIAWAGMTASFAWSRIASGPSTAHELASMAVTSLLIPPVASGWWLAGIIRARRIGRRPHAVLVDRDGTLIENVPYNGDPSAVVLRPGVRAALDRLRATGIPVAVMTNQSGIALGRLTEDQVVGVNHRVEELAGPLAGWFVCSHAPSEACVCRKPNPGLVFAAARHIGVRTARCAVIGDIEADILAAARAGARGVLVPTPATRPEEVDRAEEVAGTFDQAVARLLGPAR